MTARGRASIAVAVLGAALIWSHVATRIAATTRAALHAPTIGFSTGRVDRAGVVAEGGGVIRLPRERLHVELELSGEGPARVVWDGSVRSLSLSDAALRTSLTLENGGDVRLDGDARVRVTGLVVERARLSGIRIALAIALVGTAFALARPRPWSGLGLVAIALAGTAWTDSLAGLFLRTATLNLAPVLWVMAALAPFVAAAVGAAAVGAAGAGAGWPRPHALTWTGFAAGFGVSMVQLLVYPQPLVLGDPFAYWDIGGTFAEVLATNPLAWGRAFDDARHAFALAAPGVLYGLLRFVRDDVTTVYAAQSVAMGLAVAGMASIGRRLFSARVAVLSVGFAALHPTFAVLAGLVQPEPFILAAWVWGARFALGARSAREFVLPGLSFGVGLALHPQGMTFLVLALTLCVLPFARELRRARPSAVSFALGLAAIALPVKAAESFATPAAATLDRTYGFFAYTSPYPLGFWLFLDTNGWQGTSRMEDSEYVRGFRARETQDAPGTGVRGPLGAWPYTVSYAASRPVESVRTVLTNLHRLWHQPDNPFARDWIVPIEAQRFAHRALVVAFVLSLASLLRGPTALLAIPFVVLSMTYPAYHVFNKYATPALPFVVIGAAAFLTSLLENGTRPRALVGSLAAAAGFTLAPAEWLSGGGGAGALVVLRAGAWLALAIAIVAASAGALGRARWLARIVGLVALVASSIAASWSNDTRGVWSRDLGTPFEARCAIPPGAALSPGESAFLFVDLQIRGGDATPPRVLWSGSRLEEVRATMPDFPLAAYRGQRNARVFRQVWSARVPNDLVRSGDVTIRIEGMPDDRIFGDVRSEGNGPWLSWGEWPHLSVYRLMHEGQYRLPVHETRAAACSTPAASGAPGMALVALGAGAEQSFTRPPAVTVRRLF